MKTAADSDTYGGDFVVHELGGSHGVRRSHHTVMDAKFFVQRLHQRCGAVGRARGVRNHLHGLIVTAEIYAFHEHRRSCARRANYHLLRTRLYVFLAKRKGEIEKKRKKEQNTLVTCSFYRTYEWR